MKEVINYMNEKQKQAVVLSRFIRTLSLFKLMQPNLNMVDPNYIHQLWMYTGRWGMK